MVVNVKAVFRAAEMFYINLKLLHKMWWEEILQPWFNVSKFWPRSRINTPMSHIYLHDEWIAALDMCNSFILSGLNKNAWWLSAILSIRRANEAVITETN